MIPLRQSTASQAILIGPFLDEDDGKTAETGLTIANTDIRLSANGGNMASKNSGGGTHDEAGWYTITLDATDTATVGKLQLSVHVAGALPVWHDCVVLEEAVYDALFAASAAGYSTHAAADIWAVATRTLSALDEDSTTIDLDAAIRAAVGLASANLDTQIAALPTQAEITGGAYALDTDANGRMRIVDGTGVGELDTDSGTVLLRAATEAQIDAIVGDTNELQTDWADGGRLDLILDARASQSSVDTVDGNVDSLLAATVLASGTADSGSTTTLVDAALTQADADYWKGRVVLFTSGNLAGQCAVIEDFNAGTDTITFAPAVTQSVTTHNYVILPGVSAWDETLAEHLASGTTGNALNAAGSAGDPWATALPGAYGAGTAGNILGNNLDAAVSTRSDFDETADTVIANVTQFGGSSGTFNSGIPDMRMADAVTHGGTTALLRLGSSTSEPALNITSSGGDAVNFMSTGGNGIGFAVVGEGSGAGFVAIGGTTGYGADIRGGTTQHAARFRGSGVGKSSIELAAINSATAQISGALSGLVGGIAGAIQTFDALDTAQDTQHSTTQSAIAALPTQADITGGAYSLNTSATGSVRVVSGTSTDEIDLTSGRVSLSAATEAQIDAIEADTNELQGDDVPGLIAALNNLSAAQVWDLTDGIESSITPRQALRAIGGIVGGLASGAGTGTEVFKGLGQSSGGTTRATVTVDDDGNRSAVTLNV